MLGPGKGLVAGGRRKWERIGGLFRLRRRVFFDGDALDIVSCSVAELSAVLCLFRVEGPASSAPAFLVRLVETGFGRKGMGLAHLCFVT